MKRRKGLLAAGAILAALVLAGMWYTRPRSWESLSGSGKPDYLSADAIVRNIVSSGGQTRGQTDVWFLQQADGDAERAILAVLEQNPCRASLLDLPFALLQPKTWTHHGEITVCLRIVREPRDVSVTMISTGQVMIQELSGGRVVPLRTDPAVCEELSAIIQQYGTLQE